MNKLSMHMFMGLLLFVLLPGCATSQVHYDSHDYEKRIKAWSVLESYKISREAEDRVLSLDPENVSRSDVDNVLMYMPAPRIINVHGGIYPAYRLMESFSTFLIQMGYPENKLRNLKDGTFSFSAYENVNHIAGLASWLYEKEGLRPMLIGHSQGGFQAVRALHSIKNPPPGGLVPWNPIRKSSEERTTIIDPFNSQKINTQDVKFLHVAVVGAGGLTRINPMHWDLTFSLNDIPDSTTSFTGYHLNLDILGGDFLGVVKTPYKPISSDIDMRNVGMPANHGHISILKTRQLSESDHYIDRINLYRPSMDGSLPKNYKEMDDNELWASDIWFDIKKHWVKELQRLIHARRDYQSGAVWRRDA